MINKFKLNHKITEIQRNFLKRLLFSKAGLVVVAFNKIKSLPELVDNESKKRVLKFEKGLSKFSENTLRKSFVPLKSDFE